MSAEHENDIEMEQEEQNDAAEQKKVLTVKRNPVDDQSSATYSFTGEDHTLGNLLRNQLVKNKHVEFCAYSVPHPSESVMNVRIQLAQGGPASDLDTNKVLKASLKRVSRMCDALTEKFSTRLQEFKASQG